MPAMTIIAYLMCPVSPSNGRTVKENLETAEAWLHFLRTVTRDLVVAGHRVTIIAPWIASIRAGADESSGDDRAHGLRDDCAVAARCDLVIAAGWTPSGLLTGGMRLERDACAGPLVDLMDLAAGPSFHTLVRAYTIQRISEGVLDAIDVRDARDAKRRDEESRPLVLEMEMQKLTISTLERRAAELAELLRDEEDRNIAHETRCEIVLDPPSGRSRDNVDWGRPFVVGNDRCKISAVNTEGNRGYTIYLKKESP